MHKIKYCREWMIESEKQDTVVSRVNANELNVFIPCGSELKIVINEDTRLVISVDVCGNKTIVRERKVMKPTWEPIDIGS